MMTGARVAVRQCLGVKPGEVVLVVSDPECQGVAEALWWAASEAKAEPLLLLMWPRETNGEEPPRAVAEVMKTAAACLIPTSRSLTHTVARRQASALGARVGSMPGITPDILARSLNVDYRSIADLTQRVAAMLDAGQAVRVTTPAGTDISFTIRERIAVRDTGFYTNPGDFGNLPAGEAYIAPVEGTASGTVVVDGSIAGLGMVDAPLVVKVENGMAVAITGGAVAATLNQILDRVGGEARNIAEFGIGTNAAARVIGNILEDEKVLGTVHVGLGANAGFGGVVQVGCHLDAIMMNPSVWVDGARVMQDGRLLL